MKDKIIIFFLSFLFVVFSFSPSLVEIYRSKDLPAGRSFTLEHNYLFDYNFYLSRIREGQEGKFLVVEKYYNQPHQGSLFQILYLYLGKIGGLFRFSPPVIYHLARFLFGFLLLAAIGLFIKNVFGNRWGIVAFLLAVTAGSWPIIIRIGSLFRSATYMGWWSASDSLQRLTFIPHVLFGQIFLVLFLRRFSGPVSSASSTPEFFRNWSLRLRVTRVLSFKSFDIAANIFWGLLGFAAGIVFPPTLVIVYTVFLVNFLFELPDLLVSTRREKREWLKNVFLPRLIFVALSFPALIYLQVMFKVLPWSALALFDIQHRMGIPYREYALSLGPVLPLGLLGFLTALWHKEKRFLPFISWILSIGLLFAVFEKVPQQSPLRFTEGLVNVPLGVLAAYFFSKLYYCNFFGRLGRLIKVTVGSTVMITIFAGLFVMYSMTGWLTDQVQGRKEGTWLVPLGAQLVYPLEDFMNAIYFLRDNAKGEEVVLGYITAGNYIPAYAGNFVYIGHANTPDEDGKEKIAAEFFRGAFNEKRAREFLKEEMISYVYFGPQEKELGGVENLAKVYPFLIPVYSNPRVVIYRVSTI